MVPSHRHPDILSSILPHRSRRLGLLCCPCDGMAHPWDDHFSRSWCDCDTGKGAVLRNLWAVVLGDPSIPDRTVHSPLPLHVYLRWSLLLPILPRLPPTPRKRCRQRLEILIPTPSRRQGV